ncbi:uncharacterized protein UV8b_02710 [Ustilaginoidea virens]|uniref:Uncharacterized protein n=1 Tax=Ustilaginoidea virens TaxID=1159556 RepID=A0A8E5HMZ6_USTVR|nr:uncharacterized protein UV8b_02710 [Ustilaginoidea virens]QUC18469.1 hypothetical protein UV8b_02710 [Ustilaginoidea virens]
MSWDDEIISLKDFLKLDRLRQDEYLHRESPGLAAVLSGDETTAKKLFDSVPQSNPAGPDNCLQRSHFLLRVVGTLASQLAWVFWKNMPVIFWVLPYYHYVRLILKRTIPPGWVLVAWLVVVLSHDPVKYTVSRHPLGTIWAPADLWRLWYILAAPVLCQSLLQIPTLLKKLHGLAARCFGDAFDVDISLSEAVIESFKPTLPGSAGDLHDRKVMMDADLAARDFNVDTPEYDWQNRTAHRKSAHGDWDRYYSRLKYTARRRQDRRSLSHCIIVPRFDDSASKRASDLPPKSLRVRIFENRGTQTNLEELQNGMVVAGTQTEAHDATYMQGEEVADKSIAKVQEAVSRVPLSADVRIKTEFITQDPKDAAGTETAQIMYAREKLSLSSTGLPNPERRLRIPAHEKPVHEKEGSGPGLDKQKQPVYDSTDGGSGIPPSVNPADALTRPTIDVERQVQKIPETPRPSLDNHEKHIFCEPTASRVADMMSLPIAPTWNRILQSDAANAFGTVQTPLPKLEFDFRFTRAKENPLIQRSKAILNHEKKRTSLSERRRGKDSIIQKATMKEITSDNDETTRLQYRYGRLGAAVSPTLDAVPEASKDEEARLSDDDTTTTAPEHVPLPASPPTPIPNGDCQLKLLQSCVDVDMAELWFADTLPEPTPQISLPMGFGAEGSMDFDTNLLEFFYQDGSIEADISELMTMEVDTATSREGYKDNVDADAPEISNYSREDALGEHFDASASLTQQPAGLEMADLNILCGQMDYLSFVDGDEMLWDNTEFPSGLSDDSFQAFLEALSAPLIETTTDGLLHNEDLDLGQWASFEPTDAVNTDMELDHFGFSEPEYGLDIVMEDQSEHGQKTNPVGSKMGDTADGENVDMQPCTGLEEFEFYSSFTNISIDDYNQLSEYLELGNDQNYTQVERNTLGPVEYDFLTAGLLTNEAEPAPLDDSNGILELFPAEGTAISDAHHSVQQPNDQAGPEACRGQHLEDGSVANPAGSEINSPKRQVAEAEHQEELIPSPQGVERPVADSELRVPGKPDRPSTQVLFESLGTEVIAARPEIALTSAEPTAGVVAAHSQISSRTDIEQSQEVETKDDEATIAAGKKLTSESYRRPELLLAGAEQPSDETANTSFNAVVSGKEVEADSKSGSRAQASDPSPKNRPTDSQDISTRESYGEETIRTPTFVETGTGQLTTRSGHGSDGREDDAKAAAAIGPINIGGLILPGGNPSFPGSLEQPVTPARPAKSPSLPRDKEEELQRQKLRWRKYRQARVFIDKGNQVMSTKYGTREKGSVERDEDLKSSRKLAELAGGLPVSNLSPSKEAERWQDKVQPRGVKIVPLSTIRAMMEGQNSGDENE